MVELRHWLSRGDWKSEEAGGNRTPSKFNCKLSLHVRIIIFHCLVYFVVHMTIATTYMHFPIAMANTTYVVGGALGWNVPPKPDYYEAWIKGKKFIKGDSFWFMFEEKNIPSHK
ncbi:hypothetical protein R6Q57_018865 [Mikania cordata]